MSMFAKQPELIYAEYLIYEHESLVKHCLGVGESLDLRLIDLAIALSEIYEDVEL
jgi:hypothetical protein